MIAISKQIASWCFANRCLDVEHLRGLLQRSLGDWYAYPQGTTSSADIVNGNF